MAKITLTIPELTWRRETADIPRGKTQVVKELLRAQQDRINQQLSRRNEETLRELDAAAASRGRWGTLAWLGLGALLGTAAAVLLSRRRGKQAEQQQPSQESRGFVSQALGKGKQAASQAAAKTRQIGRRASRRTGENGEQADGGTEQAGVTLEEPSNTMAPPEPVILTAGSGQPETRVVGTRAQGAAGAPTTEASDEGLLIEPEERRG